MPVLSCLLEMRCAQRRAVTPTGLTPSLPRPHLDVPQGVLHAQTSRCTAAGGGSPEMEALCLSIVSLLQRPALNAHNPPAVRDAAIAGLKQRLLQRLWEWVQ